MANETKAGMYESDACKFCSDHFPKARPYICEDCDKLLFDYEQPAKEQARAEVLAACVVRLKKVQEEVTEFTGLPIDVNKFCARVLDECKQLQPAAANLEALLDEAHVAGAVIAGEQLLKSLTPKGGDFAVDSPPAKVKKRVEELLRGAELKGRLRELKDWPQLCIGHTDNSVRHAKGCKYHQEIAELEKARAILGEK